MSTAPNRPIRQIVGSGASSQTSKTGSSRAPGSVGGKIGPMDPIHGERHYNTTMSIPPTPFDAMYGVLQLFTNVAGDIQRSTQQWMDQLQQNLVELSERFAKGMAEYEKVETEAFTVLKRGGWLGMERHFTGPQVRSVLEISKTKGEAAANDAIRDYFNANDSASLVAMSNEWLDVPYLRDREQIIRDAISAHRSGYYTLTVPALLPLAEGLSAEIMGSMPGKTKCRQGSGTRVDRRESRRFGPSYIQMLCFTSSTKHTTSPLTQHRT